MTTLSPAAGGLSPHVHRGASAPALPWAQQAQRAARLRPFAAEWLVLGAGLAVAGALIAGSLYQSYGAVGEAQQHALQVQAGVVDDNIGLQLHGMNQALESVRDDFLATPPAVAGSVVSARLKALSGAIPGVRSMVVLDARGVVVASSVATLMGRDFGDREYFRAPRAHPDPAVLHMADPYRTSLGVTTLVFTRSFTSAGGSFAGLVAAALEPAYFEVLLRSVLYAPDMRVSLGHGNGTVFAATPGAAAPAGNAEAHLTAVRDVSPAALRMDRPLVLSVSRSAGEVFAPWRQQALQYALFFVLLGGGASFGLYRGQLRRTSFARLQARAADQQRQAAQQLELAMQGSDMGLWDWHLSDDRLVHHEAVHLDFGYGRDELPHTGMALQALIHPDDVARLRNAIETHLRGQTAAYECEFRVRHRAGQWVWLLSRGKVVERDDEGAPLRMAGSHMDLTARKRIEMQMQRTAELLHRTGELAHIGGWELDLATMRVDWTEQVFHIHELAPGEVPALEGALDFYAPEGRAVVAGAIETAMRDGTPWDVEVPFVTAKGNPRWVRSQGHALYDHERDNERDGGHHGGRPSYLVGAFQDITEKKTIALELEKLNQQLTRLSTTDALTEIGNRRLFDQSLQTEWQRASRRGERLGLLMIDIDHFKDYNDHYGHPAGDACLRRVAAIVGDCVRRGGELVTRYGGEEFALLLPGADLEAAREMAERCRRAVGEAKIEHRASATSAWLSVSIGAASQTASAAVDARGLVNTADAALYRAKRCGRDRIES